MGQIGTGGTANVSMDSSLILSGGEFDSNLSDYVKVVTGGDATCVLNQTVHFGVGGLVVVLLIN